MTQTELLPLHIIVFQLFSGLVAAVLAYWILYPMFLEKSTPMLDATIFPLPLSIITGIVVFGAVGSIFK